MMQAIIAGATGLTGQHLLPLLLNEPSYSKVIAIVRSPLDLQHPKLEQLIVDFERLDHYSAQLKADVIFCALGTTKRKTPDEAQYRKIDYEYPLSLAAIALTNGASQYHLVSAMGADEKSGLFYSRLKGEVERDLKKMAYPALHIYRPSLLDGERKEERSGEAIMMKVLRIINPLLIGGLKKYRSISISKLAAAMLKRSLSKEKGIFIYPSDQIEMISQS